MLFRLCCESGRRRRSTYSSTICLCEGILLSKWVPQIFARMPHIGSEFLSWWLAPVWTPIAGACLVSPSWKAPEGRGKGAVRVDFTMTQGFVRRLPSCGTGLSKWPGCSSNWPLIVATEIKDLLTSSFNLLILLQCCPPYRPGLNDGKHKNGMQL